MTNLLITGGAGFIGSNFVRYWSAKKPDDEIIVLDSLTYAANESSIAGVNQVKLVRGDIRDTELVARLLREKNIDTLVHFAAESHVDRSIDAPDQFIATNVTGTHSLLKAARAVWLEESGGRQHRFHHVSTDEVFGSLDAQDAAFTENSPYRPNSPYSASKAASDHLVRAYNRTFGLQVTTSNCSNNYGPFQHPEKLIPFFILNALHGRKLPLFGDGMNVRDWLHVSDHCRAIDACLQRGKAGESYNLGGGVELRNTEVVATICDAIDAEFACDPTLIKRYPEAPPAVGNQTASLVELVQDRPGHDRRYSVSYSKAHEELAYAPTKRFSSGLRETMRWYLRNEHWWRELYPPIAPLDSRR